jgi:uncharacterized protein involved in outer membrane biogenesis
MLKKVLIALVVIIVIVGAGAYYLVSNLGGIVKAAVENYGSAATQAKVTVDSVDLSLSSGEGSFSNLFIGNPSGFATPQAVSVGTVSVKVDTSGITAFPPSVKFPVVIKEVVIASPSVTYERGSDGGNLEKIQENVQRYAGMAPGGQTQPSAPADGKDEPKFIIENLYVRDGKVAISHAALQGRTLSSGLPTIHLKDIGKDKGGATPAEVAEKVVGAITQQASKIASVDLDKALGQLKGAVGEQLQGVGGAVQQNLPSGTGTDSVGDRLKGILGGEKK